MHGSWLRMRLKVTYVSQEGAASFLSVRKAVLGLTGVVGVFRA